MAIFDTFFLSDRYVAELGKTYSSHESDCQHNRDVQRCCNVWNRSKWNIASEMSGSMCDCDGARTLGIL